MGASPVEVVMRLLAAVNARIMEAKRMQEERKKFDVVEGTSLTDRIKELREESQNGKSDEETEAEKE